MAGSAMWPTNPGAGYRRFFEITASDTVVLAEWTRAIECSADCTLMIVDPDGKHEAKVFVKGVITPVQAARVLLTGSTVGSAKIYGYI